VGVMESEEAELVEGTEKVGSEGASEVKAKGLRGPVAGEDNVMGGTEALAREVGAPGAVGGREEALNVHFFDHQAYGLTGKRYVRG
jgi:hypothetical protein